MKPPTLQHYWSAFTNALPLLVLFSVLAGGVALFAARQVPAVYQAHFSYLVSLGVREQTAEYQFDGFYALQATDLFTATLAGWAQAPELVAAAYEAAGLALPTQDPRRLVSKIEARKTAPQLVEVTIRETDPTRAQQLAEGLTKVLVAQVAQYHAESIPGLAFNVTATEPWQGVRTVGAGIVGIATAVFSFFVLVNVWLLYMSFGGASNARKIRS